MLLVVALMTVAIAMLAFAPTYAAIGMAAPLIIVLARLLQGFSAGGEFGSSTSFLIESAPPHRRGFYGSWQMVGQGLSVLIGTLGSLTRGLSPGSLDLGLAGPVLFGLLIGRSGFTSAAISTSPLFENEGPRLPNRASATPPPMRGIVGLHGSCRHAHHLVLRASALHSTSPARNCICRWTSFFIAQSLGLVGPS
jgi:MFS family permease